MTEQFDIPPDPSAADGLAGELGELATAAEWKRAAIVYARVRVQDCQGRPAGETVNPDRLSPEQYAQRGIHGLRSKTTVRAYWRAWDNAVAEGLAQPVSLGDTVELPEAEWSDYYPSSGQPTTPPYYKPLPSLGQPFRPNRRSDFVDDSGDELYLLSDLDPDEAGEDLGLGACPPMVSSIDDDERSSLGSGSRNAGPTPTSQRRNGGRRPKLKPTILTALAHGYLRQLAVEGENAELRDRICELICQLDRQISGVTAEEA
jgi:hypothetical protein